MNQALAFHNFGTPFLGFNGDIWGKDALGLVITRRVFGTMHVTEAT
jgi:hypothetical protein